MHQTSFQMRVHRPINCNKTLLDQSRLPHNTNTHHTKNRIAEVHGETTTQPRVTVIRKLTSKPS